MVRHVPTWQPPRSTAVSPPPTALSPASRVDLGLPGHVPARPASRAWPASWRPHTHTHTVSVLRGLPDFHSPPPSHGRATAGPRRKSPAEKGS